MPGKGKLIVISGPSGAGKTSICKGVLARLPDSVWSVSVTTRPLRGAEADGADYHFVSQAEFERMVAADELLEHALYAGHWYGTPLRPVQQATAAGRHMVLEIDVQGGAQVKAKVEDAVLVFVLPPTMETLKARLEGRKTESEAIQQRRLAQADGEIAFARTAGVYRYFITNDILEDSVQQVLDIVRQEMQRA
ncbi:MAG: guanylate kinase [Phycisphaerae bacterium]